MQIRLLALALPIGAVAFGVGTYTMIEPATALCFGRHC